MPRLPQLPVSPQSKDVTDTFFGYNHRIKIRDGEFYHMENLSTRDFPMLATRRRRGMVRKLAKPQGLLAKGGKLAWVDDGTLYYDGEAVYSGLSKGGQKQLVNMGAYICVFPDKVYYNTADPSDSGRMELSGLTLPAGATYTLCTVTGAEIQYETEKPENPANGQYWYDRENNSLKCYSEAQGDWVTVATVYTKVSFPSYTGDLTDVLHEYDGVEIIGAAYEEVNGNHALYVVGPNYFVIVALIDTADESETGGSITISRTVPDLNFVCECQNRLWGCYYGPDKSGKILNEVYCCALGDPKNWRSYMGLSTDSWTASVGSDGPWTGAVNFLGYPTFFKENTIHRVTVSSTGAHSIYETPARGVQEGSGESIAIVNEELIYKSRADVCAYQGGFPAGLSQPLGEQRFSGAVGGTIGSFYYVSMLDEDRHWNLFVYDLANGIWAREDDLHVLHMAAANDSLYALDADGVLWDLTGHTGETETKLHWIAQSGILYYQNANKKYTSRYNIMLSAPKSTRLQVFVQYDSDGVWRYHGEVHFTGTNSITFPVRPRRCNHLELRLEGEGDAKVFSIDRILEEGSDV